MLIRVFISYRREDSAFETTAIYEKLAAEFGPDNVFLDVDTIPAGQDFRAVIRHSVQACDVLIAVIGDRWISAVDASGKRRLDKATDFVRIEIEAALERNVPVIPLFVGQAFMPDADELPPSLREFAFRNGLAVRPGRDFRNDIEQLLRQIRLTLAYSERQAARPKSPEVTEPLPLPPPPDPAASSPEPTNEFLEPKRAERPELPVMSTPDSHASRMPAPRIEIIEPFDATTIPSRPPDDQAPRSRRLRWPWPRGLGWFVSRQLRKRSTRPLRVFANGVAAGAVATAIGGVISAWSGGVTQIWDDDFWILILVIALYAGLMALVFQGRAWVQNRLQEAIFGPRVFGLPSILAPVLAATLDCALVAIPFAVARMAGVAAFLSLPFVIARTIEARIERARSAGRTQARIDMRLLLETIALILSLLASSAMGAHVYVKYYNYYPESDDLTQSLAFRVRLITLIAGALYAVIIGLNLAIGRRPTENEGGTAEGGKRLPS